MALLDKFMQAKLWYGRTVLGSHQCLPDAPPIWEQERDARGTERKNENTSSRKQTEPGTPPPGTPRPRSTKTTATSKHNEARQTTKKMLQEPLPSSSSLFPVIGTVPYLLIRTFTVLWSGPMSLIDRARSLGRRPHCFLGGHGTAPYLKGVFSPLKMCCSQLRFFPFRMWSW